jgi:hypothetical protein
MAGLYETAIEALCMRELDGRKVRPKIAASTAAVREAQDQIQALFERPLTQMSLRQELTVEIRSSHERPQPPRSRLAYMLEPPSQHG